ncbi:helix-turn-helix domain-containing protein [Micromonospora endophytica]|uniref:XRE family transcriptional regulator n=1 Tax=Micromonospora endophytica TaxID=515350 RepID=A0A2W2CVF5_9ACTN|nr:helix-turn-helix transcriptional regulator [Micromonospora endophytica]PZF97284.1 XRE family transcriptional regulator [Micromonospora endophytica]RIW43354.1 XRE family transcriptional regulator [Micromonospora endophytica]BCJ58771.1 hypothetical protein Jiend_21930 [Micromonospora endophytica]
MSLLRRVIGGVLRRERQRQGLTLRELAQAAGVSVPYLSEVERGRKEASSEVLAAICGALGLYLSDLLEEVRDELRRVERRLPAAPQARYLPARSGIGQVPAGRRIAPVGFGTDGSTQPVARLHGGGFGIPSTWLGGHALPVGGLDGAGFDGSRTGGIRVFVLAEPAVAAHSLARSPRRLPAASRSRPGCRRRSCHPFCRGRICRRQNRWKASGLAAQAG